LDDATFTAEKQCLSSSGPVRFVNGGTEFVGQGLELFFGPPPTQPNGTPIKSVSSVRLYAGPSGALIVDLGDRSENRDESVAPMLASHGLLDVLAEIAARTGTRIAVDATVKSGSVATPPAGADVKTALETVLADTPYAFRQVDREAYLVYRPISVTFRGDDLRRAIQDIAEKAGVIIVCDPNISGEVYADLQDVPLETALDILLAGSPIVVDKTPECYRITDRAKPSMASAQEKVDAVQVQARFMLLDNALVEALQRGYPIEGVPPEDANALHAIGAELWARRTPLLEPGQVDLLLRAIRRSRDCKALAAPCVTVVDAKPAAFSLTEELDYVSGYRQASDGTQEPVPERGARTVGVTFEITPHLLDDRDDIRLQFKAELNSLIEMHQALYQGRYEYDVPSFETVTIQSEIVVPDGHAALIQGHKVHSLDGTEPSADKPARDLFILIRPQKTTVAPPSPASFGLNDRRPGDAGMGALRP